jgi:membrane-associated phospholipid phosphatase
MIPKAVTSLAIALAACTVSRTGFAADPDRVEWSDDWPRASLWEVGSAVVLTIGDTLFEDNVPISSTRWRGGILFDDWARSVFRGQTPAVQSTASTISDFMFYGGVLVPFVVDNYFVTLDVHRNADVAVQMLVINMQSLGVSGIISLVGEHTVGRARPYVESCRNGHVYDAAGGLLPNTCGVPNDNRSFPSGHVAAVTTMAALTCVHHQHLPLYGGGFADLAPCLVMMGVAASTGFLRLVYDEHWASDVITGWALGAASGYVLPSLLHYGFGSGHPLAEIHTGDLTLVPTLGVYGGAPGIGAVGVF